MRFARCRCRRGPPQGEACRSSRKRELRGRVGLSRSLQRSVELVVTTDRLIMCLLLRGGGDPSLFIGDVERTGGCGSPVVGAALDLDCMQRINDGVLAEGSNGRV